MVTNAQFVAALQAMSVTGIAAGSHYDQPPAALNTADLPCAFPLLPSSELGDTLLSCVARNKRRSMQFAVVFEAAGQGTIAQNYALIAGHMDNLEAALDGLAVHGGGTTANWVDYTLTTGTVMDVAGTEYWAVVADITARDT